MKSSAQVVRRRCVIHYSTFSAPSAQKSTNTQIVAAIVSMLNDYQISRGQPTLGFLNYWLYDGALQGINDQRGINDITSGSNPGCGTEGFPATPGWDPVGPASFVSGFSTVS